MKYHNLRLVKCGRFTLWVFLLFPFFLYSQAPTVSELNRAYTENRCDILKLDNAQAEIEDAEWYYLMALCKKQNKDYEAARHYLTMADSLGFPAGKIYYHLHFAAIESALENKEESLEHVKSAVALGFSNLSYFEDEVFDTLKDEQEFIQLKNSIAPSFDTWTSLFLFVSLQALFVCIALLALKGGNRGANQLLASLIFTFSVILFSYVLYWTRYNSLFPYLNAWYHPLLFLTGPLFYLYIRNLILQVKLSRRDLWHFSVPLIVAILLYPFLVSPFQEGPFSGLFSTLTSTMIAFGTNSILKIVYLGVYLALSIRLFYSQPTGHLHNWYKYILMSFGGYFLTIVMYYVLVNFSFFNPTWDYMISFAMSFFVFVVSFLGYIHPQALAGIPLSSLANPFKYKNSSLTSTAEEYLRKELLVAMEEKELYRFEISLDDLAEKVNSNRHNVSMVINKYFQVNYFDFINKYRIEYVKKHLLDPEASNTPIINIAYDAGFNNKVTFNKAFKRLVGCTPMSYRATQGKIKESI